jgi:hypothetical protein
MPLGRTRGNPSPGRLRALLEASDVDPVRRKTPAQFRMRIAAVHAGPRRGARRASFRERHRGDRDGFTDNPLVLRYQATRYPAALSRRAAGVAFDAAAIARTTLARSRAAHDRSSIDLNRGCLLAADPESPS